MRAALSLHAKIAQDKRRECLDALFKRSLRVMMGSDLPSNVPVEVAKYKGLEPDLKIYAQVTGGNAIGAFKLA